MKFIENFNPNDPTTEGEQFLIDIFKKSSTFDGFTIFEEPHINGLKPDFVLIHPEQGILIIEVKDWDLNNAIYLNDGYILGENNKKIKKDPREQVEQYKNHILKYYLGSTIKISDHEGQYYGLIETVVYFHKATRNGIDIFLDKKEKEHTKIWTKEDVEKFLSNNAYLSKDLYTYTITGEGYKFKDEKNREMAKELICLLNYSDYNYERVEPLKLDYAQNELAKLKPNSIRRWGGVVGSGKTVVLCDKAVRALKDNNKVLIVYFNITLRSHLRDLCSQQMGEDKSQRKKLRSHLTIIHFHELLRGVMYSNGLKFYKDQNGHQDEDFTNYWLEEIYNKLTAKDWDNFTYDSILIDEGQDFKKEWIVFLQQLYKKTGEFFITYDRDQDLYDHSIWLENSTEVRGLGFRGQAGILETSKRIPNGICVKINSIFNNKLDKRLINKLLTKDNQLNLLEEMIWDNRLNTRSIEDLEYIYMIFDSKVGKYNIKLDDITILTISDDVGVKIANFFKRKGMKIYHTYDLSGHKDNKIKKTEKWKFNNGTGKLKISSYHSFKGWECPNIIFILDVFDNHINNNSSTIENGIFISMSRVKARKGDGQYSYTCLNYIDEYNYLEKEFL